MTPFLGNVLGRLWARRDATPFHPVLADKERSQWWDAAQLDGLRTTKLNRVLQHAYAHSPFYRKQLGSVGYDGRQEVSVAELSRFPVLTKDMVREHRDVIVADDCSPARMVPKRTGGSTSVPLKLFIDRAAWTQKTAATWRHNRWAGYDIADKHAMVWGNTPPPATWREMVRRVLWERFIALDTLAMTDEAMRQFVSACRRFHPRIIMGHAHSLYLFADFCRRQGLSIGPIRGAITTAMVLTARDREAIEAAFDCRVFNRYGCEEVSVIASECAAHDGLHLHAEGLIAEVENEGKPCAPGEYGELILTDLDNIGMAFIRYRIGDVSAVMSGACSCGRTLPRLAEVRGRTADFLYTPEGTRVFGISVLDTMMIHVPGIKQAQLIQEVADRLRVRVVATDEFEARGRTRLLQELPRYFGDAMQYDIELVDRIPPERNGKYRFAICRLPAA